MKKFKFIIAALAVCGSANAQVITETGKIFDYEGISPILSEFTVDGKAKFLAGIYDDEEDKYYFKIYNDELEYIDVNIETEPVTRYRKIRQREYARIFSDEGELIAEGYIGDWVEDEYEYVYGDNALSLRSYNLNTGVDRTILFTQTLFNNDEEYEYIIPTYKTEIETEERDRDGDGSIDYESTTHEAVSTGFKIKSTDGSTLQTVTLSDEYEFDEIGGFYIINGKYYLSISARAKDGNYYEIFYRIDKGTSSIQQVGVPMKMSVSPRVADRSETFTVELDGDSGKPCEVVVATAAGQTVWRQHVKAGQTSVNISAARLGKGLNIITVNGRPQKESCKVIVK